jgi:superfamily II DNA or RNA helicase
VSDVTIQKLNDTFLLVDADMSIAAEISDFFTFEPPNAFWMRKKRPMWDGKIRLYHMDKRLLYVGLLTHLLEFCDKWGYSVELDQSLVPEIASVDDIEAFIDNLDVRNEDGDEIACYDHQAEAVQQCIRFGRRTIVSPTASGKSLIIYILLRWYEAKLRAENKKTLIVVPTIGLVSQMASDIWDYSSQDAEFDAEYDILKIAEGSDKNSETACVYISTWQSIYQESPEYFEQFGMIIADECHQYKADAIKGILEKSINTPLRFGLTGTLTADGSKCNKLIIQGLFGPQIKIASTRELMDKGIIAGIDINIINTYYSEETAEFARHMDYHQEIDFITKSQSRNEFLTRIVSAEKKNTLLLFLKQDHGERLFEMVVDANPGRPIYLIYGKHPADEREEVRRLMETHTDAIAICSFGTFSTGVNIKNIHTVIFASPSKSAIRVLQSIGRGLRKLAGKTVLKLIDIVDIFQIGNRRPNNYCVQHSVERMKLYAAEEFDYKLIDVEIE